MNTQFTDEAQREERVYSRSHCKGPAKPVELQFHPPSTMLDTMTFHPKTPKSPCFCITGRSGTGGAQEMGARAALSPCGWES